MTNYLRFDIISIMFNRSPKSVTESATNTSTRIPTGYRFDSDFAIFAEEYKPMKSCSDPELAEFIGLPYKPYERPVTASYGGNHGKESRKSFRRKVLTWTVGIAALASVFHGILEQNDGGELGGEQIVVVKPGDTISEIIFENVDMTNECDWRKVKYDIEKNPANQGVLEGNTIHPGNTLKIPKVCN